MLSFSFFFINKKFFLRGDFPLKNCKKLVKSSYFYCIRVNSISITFHLSSIIHPFRASNIFHKYSGIHFTLTDCLIITFSKMIFNSYFYAIIETSTVTCTTSINHNSFRTTCVISINPRHSRFYNTNLSRTIV